VRQTKADREHQYFPAFVERHTREWLDARLPAYWGTVLEAATRVRHRLGPERSRVSPEAWQAALTIVEELLENADSQLAIGETEEVLFKKLLQPGEPVPGGR
jgi:hypothetical protein